MSPRTTMSWLEYETTDLRWKQQETVFSFSFLFCKYVLILDKTSYLSNQTWYRSVSRRGQIKCSAGTTRTAHCLATLCGWRRCSSPCGREGGRRSFQRGRREQNPNPRKEVVVLACDRLLLSGANLNPRRSDEDPWWPPRTPPLPVNSARVMDLWICCHLRATQPS